MFKKTLLALSVTAFAGAASAGTIYTAVTDSTKAATIAALSAGGAGDAVNDGTGAAAAGAGAAQILATNGNCEVAAADLSVTLSSAGFNNTALSNDDTISIQTSTALTNDTGEGQGTFQSATSVTMTANDACSILVADTTSTTPISSGLEAAQNVDVLADAVIVSGIGGYDVGDTITIQISGALIDKAATEALVPTLTDRSGEATINVLDVEPGAVRFTVVGATDTPASVILDLTNVVLDATGLSADTQVSYNAFATNTSGTDFDISPASVVADLVPQYSATSTVALDGVIDVSLDRQAIADEGSNDNAGVGENANEDTYTITISEDATGTVLTPAETVYTFSGDFSWMIDADVAGNDDGIVDPAEIATVVTYSTTSANTDTVTYALNADMNELTATSTLVTQLDLVNTFVFAVSGQGDGNAVLNETDYSVSVVVNDTTTGASDIPMTAATNLAAGSWSLNGSVVTVPYMPFGDNTKVILRHTNTGVQTGDVSVRYMLEGVSTNWETVGVVASSSRGVMDIRDSVINAIMADAGVTKGKVAIEITTNVPDADVTVYAGYNVNNSADDRGFVGTFGNHGSAQ